MHVAVGVRSRGMDAGLPRGTVTFLFTDIEGSTELSRRHGATYGDVRAEHRRVLREVFAAHRGCEIDAEGDAFFIGFAQWACENQRPENLRANAITNPHSPGKYRINGIVSNMPEFTRAFKCGDKAPMVREKACKVW